MREITSIRLDRVGNFASHRLQKRSSSFIRSATVEAVDEAVMEAGWKNVAPDDAVAGEGRNADSGTDGDLPLDPLRASLFVESTIENNVFVFFSGLIDNEGSCDDVRDDDKRKQKE